MMAETVTQSHNNMPPDVEQSGQFQPVPNPQTAEFTPVYTMSEAEIRRKVADAVRQQPSPEVNRFLIVNDPLAQRLAARNKGRVEDIERARLEAEAAAPYQERSLAYEQQYQDIVAELPNRGTKRDLLRNPYKFTTVLVRGIKPSLLSAIYLTRADAAAEMVAMTYESLLDTALRQPFVQQLKPIPEVVEALSPHKLLHKHEPATEPAPVSNETLTLVRDLKLNAQAQEQAQILLQAGILDRLPNGQLGTNNEHGTFPLPDLGQLQQVVEKHKDLIAEKAAQGFTRLLYVPEAVAPDVLAAHLSHSLSSHHAAKNLHDAYGNPVLLSDSTAHKLVDDIPYLPSHIRHPKSFNRVRHGGQKIKAGSLSPDSEIPGWKIMLVKDMPELPEKPRDIVTMGKPGAQRPEFIPGLPPKYYLRLMQSDARYRGELGFTIETYLMFAISQIERTGTVPDVNGKTLLLGSYNNRLMRQVLAAGWDREFPNAPKSGKFMFGGNGINQHNLVPLPMRKNPNMVAEPVGARTVVELT